MSSNYPGSLDNFSTSHVDGVNEAIHASTINDLADAVNKIETALGTNPVLGSAGLTSTAATATMTSSAASGATTITIPNQPSWVRVGQRVVIDPYTSICEAGRIKTVSGSTITLQSALANNHAANTLVYTPPRGVYDVTWWGANGKNGTGNEVPINAAATAAAVNAGMSNVVEGTVYIPKGNYLISGQINIPKYVNVVGDGPYQSVVQVSSDLGTGFYGILVTDRDNGRNAFKDFQLVISGSFVIPSPPNNMRGLAIGSSSLVENVAVSGFYANLCCKGNHSVVRRYWGGNCFYDIYFEDGTQYGFGNWLFERLWVESHARAAFGVSADSEISGSYIHDFDCGKGPFAFYNEGGSFLDSVTIKDMGCEEWGNGLFYDAETVTANQRFSVDMQSYGGTSTQAAVYEDTNFPVRPMNVWGGKSSDVWDARAIHDEFGSYTNIDMFMTKNLPGLITNLDLLVPQLTAKSKPLATSGSGSTPFTTTDGGAGYIRHIADAGGMTIGQLMYVVNATPAFSVYPTAGGVAPAGFALMGGSQNYAIPGQARGGTVGSVPCTGAVAIGNYLKPSTTTAGSVQAATGFSDGPIVGVALSAGTNTTISVQPRCW